MPRVLVVDARNTTRDVVAQLLGERDVGAAATSREAANAALRQAITDGRSFDVVLLDCDLASAAVVRELVTVGGGVRVLLIAKEAAEGAGLAQRCGASDVVLRPLSAEELAFRVARAAGGPGPGAVGDGGLRRPRKSDVLVGTGGWIKEMYDRIAMVAATDATVAIFGESGTGKELVARTIHNSSPRHDAPFVVVNCAAIPEQLLEDELFGHVRGAFTDASRDREGLLAAAHTGSLFLDEIGELPLGLQAKLLRVLQSQEFRRLGDDADRKVDVRIITATNRKLEDQIARGLFREDLFYRINVFPLHLPPLRERREDIPLLVHHFLTKYRARLGKPVEGFAPGALARLVQHDWPGNVRELENKVHQAMVVATEAMIADDDVSLPAASARIGGGAVKVDITRTFRDVKQETIDAFEVAYLTELLRAYRGNLAQAARAAGMDRKNLWALVERHKLDRTQFKK